MNNTIIAFTALALAAACTPAPQVCERTLGMSKEGIPIMLGEPCVIAPARVAQPIEWDHDDGDEVSLPTLPETPTSPPVTPPSEPEDEPETPTPPVVEPPVVEPPVVEPETPDDDEDNNDRPKGDNSDANGKGGNKHDRDDFTHGGTETAEEKKDE